MDRVEEIAAAIVQLEPADKQRLFQRLADMRELPGQVAAPTTGASQLELVPSDSKKGRSPDYILVFDGGSRGNPGPGYGSYAITHATDGAQRLERLEFGDGYTNNEAEYDSLIEALQDLIQRIEQGGRQPEEFILEVRGDSALVINQVQGRWKAKEPRMRVRRNRCQGLLGRFRGTVLTLQPREESVRLLGH
jgi:ribonuclease HI